MFRPLSPGHHIECHVNVKVSAWLFEACELPSLVLLSFPPALPYRPKSAGTKCSRPYVSVWVRHPELTVRQHFFHRDSRPAGLRGVAFNHHRGQRLSVVVPRHRSCRGLLTAPISRLLLIGKLHLAASHAGSLYMKSLRAANAFSKLCSAALA